MASLITTIIPQQAYEVVHNRIGEILVEELANQHKLTGDDDLDLDVYKERDIPLNEGEFPAINVMLDRSTFVSQTIEQNDGIFRYLIEAVDKAPSDDDTLGDAKAMTKVQRLLGVCRGILEHSAYKRLGFAPPFIQNRHVEEIFFGRPVRQDSAHVSMGRIAFMVKVAELNGLEASTLLAGHDTTVKLELTDKGYLWILEP